ncbi:hypothetical protein QAD02_000502 [Eretmocerus hayati]|uniref:Uncharacterized protein n=1 Tax=Eretmocerus hayati TaxID=131215 RepID=A0ACC2NEN4_9HYME|nr:hypothetical protein QAD02_000502 [Eretmocerus hayati]
MTSHPGFKQTQARCRRLMAIQAMEKWGHYASGYITGGVCCPAPIADQGWTWVIVSSVQLDKTALISAVYKRKPLWEKRDDNYPQSHHALSPLWDGVLEEMNIKITPQSKSIVRGRWTSLKNGFNTAWSKRPKLASGSEAKQWVSRNPDYKAMMFLKTNRQNRKSLSNHKPSVPLHSENFYDSDHFDDEDSEGR